MKVTAAGTVTPILTHDAKRLKWGRFDSAGRFAGIEFPQAFVETGESYRFVVYAANGELIWEDVDRSKSAGATLADGLPFGSSIRNAQSVKTRAGVCS